MPATQVRPPPIWRYNPTRSPLLSPSQPAAPMPPGFFASQTERTGPFIRQRPYWRYDGPLMAAAAPATSTTMALAASGAAASSGNADLNIVMSLAATGAQAATG